MSAREARLRRPGGPPRRTYLCLEGQRRKPSDYEITTSELLYYPARGFEVETPVARHYAAHQRDGRLRSPCWDSFEDPACMTYSRYVARRRDQESFLDQLFQRPAAPAASLAPLIGPLSALRFALHGLQMTAAYVGALAPSARISVAAAFQAADELRRLQRLCQWLARSGTPIAEIDTLGRERWQQQAGFQPLRRLTEELLVTYDWGEALVGANVVLKPLLDRLLFEQLAALAEQHDDQLLELSLKSLGEDATWHETWSRALLSSAIAGNPENAAVIRACVERFREPALAALAALLGMFGELFTGTAQRRVRDELGAALERGLVSILGAGGGGGRADDTTS